MKIVYNEYDRQYAANPIEYPNTVISSKIRRATVEEIEDAISKYNSTKECNHSFVIDECSWLYDFRSCAVCGEGLGIL